MANIIGNRYGRLVVIGYADDVIRPNGKPRKRCICKCDCGNEKIVYSESLTGGRTISCGCYQKEQAVKANTKHGYTNTRLYNVWCSMKRRCFSETDVNYRLYGGRGITMCDEWKDNFETFHDWAIENGYDENAKRGEYTIDRIDVNGNYEPENCRFVNQKAQMNNVRYNHILTYNNETHTIAEWADILHVPAQRITNRIDKFGYSVEDALFKPPRRTKKK